MPATIRNNYRQPLALPAGAGAIAPGDSRPIPRWNEVKDHPVVQNWIRAGRLVVVAEEPEPGEETIPELEGNADEAKAAIPDLDVTTLQRWYGYESEHKARKGVLAAIEQEIKDRGADG